jgi:hypothetical protein
MAFILFPSALRFHGFGKISAFWRYADNSYRDRDALLTATATVVTMYTVCFNIEDVRILPVGRILCSVWFSQ